MATNDFLSQFKFKRLSQSIWFSLIHVLLLRTVIVGLGFFFLLIWMNIHIKKLVLFIFCYKIFIYLFLTPPSQHPHYFLDYTPGGAAVPSAPLLPAVMHVSLQQHCKCACEISTIGQYTCNVLAKHLACICFWPKRLSGKISVLISDYSMQLARDVFEHRSKKVHTHLLDLKPTGSAQNDLTGLSYSLNTLSGMPTASSKH